MLEGYQPYNAQEEHDLKLMKDALNHDEIWHRENGVRHMTTSAWVLNEDHTKVLMCYHKIYNSWSWLGGHNDGQKNCALVALKEVKEESGLENVRLLDENVFSIEILTVDGHVKRGEYVSSHLHYNVTYLLEASEDEPLRIKEDENSNLGWFTFDQALAASTEPWFVENVYKKLNEKVREKYHVSSCTDK